MKKKKDGVPGWPFRGKSGKTLFPCAICGRAYLKQDRAGWCCFNKKESEDPEVRVAPALARDSSLK